MPTLLLRFRDKSRACKRTTLGFSLVEIAVVLVIISVLLTIVAVPLATQIEQKRVEETQKMIEGAKDALYGFASANGRLPCPATDIVNFGTTNSAGIENPSGGGVCAVQVGLLPAVTLGITPVDASGFMQDGWSDGAASRRIRYAVSITNTSALTTTDGVKTATMSTIATAKHLYVCATGLVAAPPTANCGATVVTLTDQAPAVIFSFGKNSGANSFDETNNQNADKIFTSGNANATFDDIVTWLSLNTMFSRMVQAGKLP